MSELPAKTDVMPRDYDAEKRVIGRVFMEPGFINRVTLLPNEFHMGEHQRVWAAMQGLLKEGRTIDPLTIRDFDPRLDIVYVSSLVDYAIYNEEAALAAVDIVREKARLRKILWNANKVVDGILRQNWNAEDSVSHLDHGIREFRSTGKDSCAAYGDNVDDVVLSVEERVRDPKKIQGIPTGLGELDDILRGLRKKQQIVIAGSPGLGKSALVAQILEHAIGCNYTASLHTMEMGHEELLMRNLAHKTRIPLPKIESGYLTGEELGEIRVAAGELKSYPIWINCRGYQTVNTITADAYRKQPDILVVDHLQILSHPNDPSYKGMNRNELLGEYTRVLKALAMDLHIPVITVSQLSRPIPGEEHKEPTMFRLRESGAVEANADVIIMIWNDGLHTWLSIVKNRGGKAPARIRVKYHGDILTFSGDMEEECLTESPSMKPQENSLKFK